MNVTHELLNIICNYNHVLFVFLKERKTGVKICDKFFSKFSSFGSKFKNEKPSRFDGCLDNVAITCEAASFQCVVRETSLSDHRSIQIQFDYMGSKLKGEYKLVRPLTEAGFNYSRHCLMAWPFVEDHSIDINHRWEIFVNTITECFNDYFPSK